MFRAISSIIVVNAIEDEKQYMYFGGLWGRQLQCYRNNRALECGQEPAVNEAALGASVPSGGSTWLRSLKVTELEYDKDGRTKTIEGQSDPN
jgi:hypothetical protein